jgi:hypothetical protein
MSEKLHFAVLSSDGVTRYAVEAYPTASGVRFTCDCRAGQNNQVCKHRVMLALGDCSRLIEGDAGEVRSLQAMLTPSNMLAAFRQLHELEDMAETVKSAMASLRRDLALAMHG